MRIGLGIGLGSGGGKRWKILTSPVGFDYTLPFDIHNKGLTYRVDPNFDLEIHANISVAKTYYVNTVSGDDGNTGLSSVQALKTWNAVIGKADYDKIIIENGSYLYRSQASLACSRNCKVIGQGTVYFTSDRWNNLGVWTLSSGQTYTYQSTVAGGEFISRVIDEGTLNVYGNPTPYIEKASVALVEATAGTFYWAGGVLYVHTLDGLTPTGRTNLRTYDSSAVYWSKNNVFYFENINFRGGFTLRNASAAGGAKSYVKNCNFHKGVIAGLEEFIVQDSIAKNSNDDTFNYDDLNTIVTKSIEINCDFGEGGLGSTNQASTIHNNSRCVRINGLYHDVTGQCIADIAALAQSWNIACECYNSKIAALKGTGISFYNAGKQWLESCVSHDNAEDIENIAGGTTYTKNFIGGGVNNIDGTLTPY